jgi:hypothetical protein
VDVGELVLRVAQGPPVDRQRGLRGVRLEHGWGEGAVTSVT